jgi:predicted N-formylglutamate amidohydrolase
MDLVGTVRIPVTDLDHHPYSYRILEDLAFARTNEESSISSHHVFAPFYRSNIRQASVEIRLSLSLPA